MIFPRPKYITEEVKRIDGLNGSCRFSITLNSVKYLFENDLLMPRNYSIWNIGEIVLNVLIGKREGQDIGLMCKEYSLKNDPIGLELGVEIYRFNEGREF
jgi:hypothetical protein